jgi:hypothetical protein
MSYYHNLVTDKSFNLLKRLRKRYDFILIGGWAVFLYTQALKSKDIDLVLEYDELEKLRESYEVSKNTRLKKYEARSAEVEIDIYVPFYSNPGIPAEDLKNFEISLEGFKTVEKEILSILKLKALREREGTVKGRKDLVDLISLFGLPDFDWIRYKKVLTENNLSGYSRFLKKSVSKITEIEELDLNVYKMSRLKKRVLAKV